MKKFVMLAAFAGLAVPAIAGPGLDEMTPKIPVATQLTSEQMQTPGGGFGARSLRNLFDNATGADGFYSTTLTPSSTADDISLARGGVTYPLALSQMEIVFISAGNLAATDMRVQIWDTYDNTGTVGSPVGQNLLGGFILRFTGIPTGTGRAAYTTGAVDVSSLAITLNDGGVVVTIDFLQSNTTTILPNGNFTAAIQSNYDNALFQDTLAVGTGDTFYYRDVDLNGTCEANESRFFGRGDRARFGIRLAADVACLGSSDFNGDGFTDFFDFDDFVSAFEGGC